MLDQAIRAGDVEVGVGGGMESMSQAPYLLPEARFGFRMGDAKALDAMVHDGLTQPVQRQADVRRGDRGRRRARDDPRRPRPLGAALARARARGDRRGPPARGDRPRDGQGPQGRHGRRGRRGAAPRHDARGARQAARASSARRARTRPATRRASTTAAARSCSPPTSGRERNGKEVAGRDRRPGAGRRRLRLPRHARPPARRKKALDKAGLQAERHRPVGDQRGVRLGRR